MKSDVVLSKIVCKWTDFLCIKLDCEGKKVDLIFDTLFLAEKPQTIRNVNIHSHFCKRPMRRRERI